ncbi:MAG: hypothetical protein LC798_19380 [Chloroflexi bacterium]|nr:hypothetical protein [Chloroflexota bacterium]
MGTSTPAQFARKMARLSNDMKKVTPKAVVTAAAATIKKDVQQEVAVAAPSGRLNVGRTGRRIGVRSTHKGDDAILVAMFGPAHLIERDTKPHRIPRTTGKGRKRRGDKQPLYIPGIGFKANVDHPGTKGKHPWEKGVRSALPKLDKIAGAQYAEALRRALR